MYPYEPDTPLDSSLQTEHEKQQQQQQLLREEEEEEEQEEEGEDATEEEITSTSPQIPTPEEEEEQEKNYDDNEPGLVSMLSNYVWSFFAPVTSAPASSNENEVSTGNATEQEENTRNTPPLTIDTTTRSKNPTPDSTVLRESEWTASPTDMNPDSFVVPLTLRRPSVLKGPFTYGEISPQRFASLNEVHRKSSLSAGGSIPLPADSEPTPIRRQSDPPTSLSSLDENRILDPSYATESPSSSPKSPRSRSITASPESSRHRPQKTYIVSHSLPAPPIRRSSAFDPSLPIPPNTLTFGSTLSSLDYLPQLNLIGRNPDVEVVMTKAIGELLREHLPPRIRLAESWKLAYSLDQHGISITTLYQNVKGKGPLIVAVRDNSSQVFGAYLSESLIPRSGYYGTGECFLWRVIPVSERNKSLQVRAYPWTGKNDYFIASEMSYIGVGGGDGKFGLWISSEFDIGSSATCPTFENEPLAGPEYGGEFECVELEVWYFSV